MGEGTAWRAWETVSTCSAKARYAGPEWKEEDWGSVRREDPPGGSAGGASLSTEVSLLQELEIPLPVT